MKNDVFFKTLKSIGVCFALCSFHLNSQAAVDPYVKYKGVQLTAMFPDTPHHKTVSKFLPEFTQKTGIRIQVKTFNQSNIRKEQIDALGAEEGEYDLISYSSVDKGVLGLSGGLVPLGTLFSQASINNPSYDILDFVPSYMVNIGMVGGDKGYLPGPSASLVGLPFGGETSVLAYRQDILSKYNLKVPSTYDELVKAMCLIQEKEPDMFGLASRGALGEEVTHAFLLHLAPYGVRIFDKEWKPSFNGAAGLKALQVLKKIAECGHPDMSNFDYDDAQAAFKNGETAFYLDSTKMAAAIEGPEILPITGNIGWASHPIGVRRGSQSGGFGIGIPANSKNQEAAFLFMQWITSKSLDKKISMAGGSPLRVSTMLDKELITKRPYLKTFEKALRYSDSDWRPLIPEWDNINKSILGKGVHSVVFNNAEPQKTLDRMAKEITAVMDKAGYYNFNSQ